MTKKKTTKTKPAGMPLGLALMLAHPGFLAPAKKKAAKREGKKAC